MEQASSTLLAGSVYLTLKMEAVRSSETPTRLHDVTSLKIVLFFLSLVFPLILKAFYIIYPFGFYL
jgi:hypothetical protein